MNKKDFYEVVRSITEKKLGTSFQCETSTMLKGGRTKQILVIRRKNESVSPVIHLEPFYERFISGCPMDDITEDIISVCRSTQPNLHNAVQDVWDYARASKHLIIKVINSEKNREYLTHTPHVPVNGLDLAGIFFLVLKVNEEGMAGITVTQELLKNWGKTPEELLVTARKNMEDSYPMAVKELEQVLKKLVSEEEWEFITKDLTGREQLPLYILTDTRTGMVGASGFFMKEAIHDFAMKKGCNMIIFPSSIHELLLFPETEKETDKQELYDMVRTVNQTSVTEEDFLSDHVYYYNRTTKEITYY